MVFVLSSAEHELSLLINLKMLTFVGIFIFISIENSILSKLDKKTTVLIRNSLFIGK